MNERIKQLAEQAQKVIWPADGNVTELTDLDIERFAELIVKECVTIINHGIDHTDYPHPNDTEKSMVEMKAQIWCRDAIKEHFGVK
jgi:hypothetical protein